MTSRCGSCEQDILSGEAMALVPCRIKSIPHIDPSVDPFRVEWEVRVLAWSAECLRCLSAELGPGQWVLRLCIHCGRELYIDIERPPKVLACDDSCRNSFRAKQRRGLTSSSVTLLPGRNLTQGRNNS